MVTETDRNKARSAVVSAYNSLDCATIPFSFLHALADAAVDAVSTDAEPFGWTSKHSNEGEEHRKWGRRRENVASYEGYIVQALYAEPVKTAPAVAVKHPSGSRMQGMVRSIDQYRNGDPKVIMAGSEAQALYALQDARHDILVLWDIAFAALSAQVQDVAGWQSMDSAPTDGSEFVAGRRYATDGEFVVHTYKWVGEPNYWSSKRNGVCIWPQYQDDFVWCPLPASPASKHGDVE